jgi:GR25 family glycosyltransferase involved in LPS biosynthesis
MNLSEFLKNNFKRRFVINLERRKDRYVEFLNRIPFDTDVCERFIAVDGKDLKHNYDENPYVMGCHMSHKNILLKVIEDETINDNDLILIFEDDVFFNDNFENDLKKTIPILKNLNPNFILYIGGRFVKNFKSSSFKEWEHIDFKLYNKKGDYKNIKSSDYDRTTNVIILTKHACKEIINKTKDVKFSEPIDSLYNNIRKYIPDIKLYDIFPHLCYSPINYKSDIQIKF